MRAPSFLPRLIFLTGMLAGLTIHAQTTESSTDALAVIQAKRAVIAQEKKHVLDEFQKTSKTCWQQFAVNDCLFKARRQKYQDLEPIDQREIQLNVQERTLKELERQQRLTDKASSKGKL
jgi:hypothetical protein